MSRRSRSQASWITSWIRLVAFVALATSACSSGSSSLTLSATATGEAADAGDLTDAGSGDAGINLCGQLLIDRVRLGVRKIDLKRASVGVDAGIDGGMSDAGTPSCDCPDGGTVCVKPGGHVHIGPFLVDVEGGDLAGGIHQVFDVEIPDGTYSKVKFVIKTLTKHQANGDGGLSEMKDLHASIAVDGFFGGSPFLFTTKMSVKQKQEGPFQVGPGTKNIVLTLDPRSWFIGRDGQLLDPTDPRNRGRIKKNIKCSVRMSSEEQEKDRSFRREFEDDDGDDQCREDDDDDREHGDDLHSADGGHCDGGDHDKHDGCSIPALVCGDGGTPSTDGGTDGGLDGGPDGG